MPATPTTSSNAGAGSRTWPGQRLGLPETGPRSVARPGRRIAALCIDWAIAYGASAIFFDADGLATSAIFLVMQGLLVFAVAGGIGHLLLGMRVVTLNGTWVGVWRPFLRAFLLTIVIPAAVWDADQRGLHDKLAGTVLVRV
ncbi:RDD family protein [Marisediminicola senii]|uniref:RDD family protein n=1 Tax=Marisediminicola senii TaxID=2711233 RepID=UPI0013EA55E4|nr:RDD family protein [Marisediminicola senii]